MVEGAQRLLQLQPPQSRGTIGETRRDEGREGRAVTLEDRQRVVAQVAVAVVDRDGDEGSGLRGAKPPQRLVHRDEVVAEHADAAERGVEEIRFDLEQPVRRELPRRPGPHVVQREDGTLPARPRRNPRVEPGRLEEGEAGGNDPILHARPDPIPLANLATAS